MNAGTETPDQHRAQLQKYAREYARMVQAGKRTERQAYAEIAEGTRAANFTPEQTAEVYEYLRWSLENLRTPADAVQTVYEEAAAVRDCPLPYWCAPFYSRLWASAVLLGANGRPFLFACHAFADVSGIAPSSVLSFRRAAVRAHAFDVVFDGVQGVAASRFMLAPELQAVWREVYDVRRVCQRLPWLFVERPTDRK